MLETLGISVFITMSLVDNVHLVEGTGWLEKVLHQSKLVLVVKKILIYFGASNPN
jgi:hypothetical protein